MVHEKAIAVFLIVVDIERNDSISGMLLRKGNDIYLWFTLMSVKGFVTLCGDQVWKLSLGALLLLINPYCRMEDFGLFHSWSKHHNVLCWLLTQRPTFHIYLFQSTLFLLKALAIFLHILRKNADFTIQTEPISIPREWVWHFLVWWLPARKINSCNLMIPNSNVFFIHCLQLENWTILY